MTDKSKLRLYAVIAICIAAVFISSNVFNNEPSERFERYRICTEAGGEYDSQSLNCDLPDN